MVSVLHRTPLEWYPTRNRSHQLGDRFAVVEDVHGPATAAGEGLRRVDADGTIERAEHLRHGVRPILGPFAARRAGADRLAHAETTSRDESGHDRRPVI